MSDLQKILSLAREQVGVSEQPPGSNNVIYNADYYGGVVQGANYPWCCVFVWWLFWKTGLSALFCGGAKTAYCPYVVNYAKNAGAWITNADYRPGDLFLYDWDKDGIADHIGLCVSWGGVNGQTIEGNVNERVAQLQRWNSEIMGAYRPAYADSTENAPQDATAPQNGDTYTVKPGDSLWIIAQLHNMDMQELARINGIDPRNYIYPGQVLKLRADSTDAPEIVTPDDVYTVRAGDSLWSIAQALLGNGWRWYKIAAANDLKLPYTIHPGDRLKIPIVEA